MRPLLILRRAVRAATPALALATAALTAVLAACADTPDSPTSPTSPTAHAGALRAPTATNPFRDGSGGETDTTRATVTIYPGATTSLNFNGNAVTLAPGAVCDPATAGYGPTLWDAPCAPATQPVTVRIKAWMQANGQPAALFTPDLRFVPGTVNTLTLSPRAAAAGPILWCPTGALVCVDEAQQDPSLATSTNANGSVSRPLKHFSGYTVLVR